LTAFLLAALLVAQQRPPDPQASVLRGLISATESSTPIKDARVTLTDLDRSVKTTAEGRFEFRDLVPGRYTVTVSMIGYIFVRRRVDVPFNAVVDITILLSEGTGTYLETVTVSGDTRPPPAVGVSSQGELGSAGFQDLRGVAADDPMRAMQALPGVATGDDFQAQFSVRGSAFRHVGIVTDGLATQLLMHQVRGAGDTGSVAMLNSDIVARGTLLSGPHPLRHGDWIGATLEFDLREGSRDRAAVRAAVSGTAASFVVESPLGIAKRGSWLLSIRKSYIDWLVRKIEPSVENTLGFSDLQSKWVYDLTSRQQLQVLLLAGTARFQQLTTTTANGLFEARSRSGALSVGWRYTRPSLVLTQSVSALATTFRDRGRRGQDLSRGDSRSLLWRGDVIKPLGSLWTFEGGARTESERVSQGYHRFATVGNRTVATDEQGMLASNTLASGWGQIARRTTSSGLVAGVRASNASAGSWTAVSPWLLGERTVRGVTFRAGVSGASQFPELVFVEMNPPGTIAPERARSVDAGVEQRLGKTMRWGVVGFARNESQILRRIGEDRLVDGVHVPSSTFPAFASSLDGTSRGVDLLVERRAPNGPSGWVGYTFSRTRYHDTQTGERFDGDHDQRHTLNAFVRQRVSYRFTVSAKLRVGSNFPLVGYFAGNARGLTLSDVRNQVRLPTYLRLDLQANRTFTFKTKRLTLFIEVMNVTNRRNLAQADGTISSNLTASRFADQVIPRLPSVGMLIEF